jgi:nitrite reductase/ring-hydroxylating ferredoxin subunit
MESTNALVQMADQPMLDVVAEPLADAIKGVYSSAGTAGQLAKNAMHGVWLGHPLHPVFTDLPLGAWTTGLVLDATAAIRNEPVLEQAGDVAIAVGLVGAAGAAVTGLTDWSETDGQSRRTGLIHGLLNVAATALYCGAYYLRRNGSRENGTRLAIAGYAVAIGSAWLGGDLVYDQRVGVTHADGEEPEKFTAVARSSAVPDGTMKHVEKGDADLLLARQHGKVCALAHRCTHMGGPLSEGTLKEDSVVCPWHGSEFGLEDGHVINGPATQNQPSLEVKESSGQIRVKKHD